MVSTKHQSKLINHLQTDLTYLVKVNERHAPKQDIKKGIVEATKQKGEQSDEVKALQKQLADLKSQLNLNRAILKEYESKQSAMDDAEFEKALKDEYAKGYSAGKQATYRERQEDMQRRQEM